LEVEEILKFANAVAALKCQDLGGRKGIPTLKETYELLNGGIDNRPSAWTLRGVKNRLTAPTSGA